MVLYIHSMCILVHHAFAETHLVKHLTADYKKPVMESFVDYKVLVGILDFQRGFVAFIDLILVVATDRRLCSCSRFPGFLHRIFIKSLFHK